MKKSDLFSMALQNLKNRKTRTKLTVIGVVIGTCAIVIMVSIGIGIDRMLTSQIQSNSSLVKVSVYKQWSEETGTESLPLDDRAVEYLNKISHVETVCPIYEMDQYIKISRGRYSYQNGIKAIDFDIMSKIGFIAEQGRLDGADGRTNIFFGERTATSFYDAEGNAAKYKIDENMNIVDCEIDLMKDVFTITPNIYDEMSASVNYTPKRVKTAGVVTSSDDSNGEAAYSVYIDMDFAKELILESNKINGGKNVLPEYSRIFVYVDKMSNVEEVQDKIEEAGFSSYSNRDELEYTKKIMLVVQLVLGAIGAISMFVAAFGISNTMVMSVYERTKEIGIMKVLGCDIKDIKSLFLYEAGIIGFLGGTIGMAISYVVSFIANAVAKLVVSNIGADTTVCVSHIPLWLCISGIAFSVLVGVLAGRSPAKRSVNVSALTAIHNE